MLRINKWIDAQRFVNEQPLGKKKIKTKSRKIKKSKSKCKCWAGYERVRGTPCAKKSCRKK
jgi:hypothetical protein